MKRFKRCSSDISETLWSCFKIQGRNFRHEHQNWLHIIQLFVGYKQYQASSVAFILFLPLAMCPRCCVPCCGIYWQNSVGCKHCLEKDVWVGEHWISSKKLLKLAQLYPLYCTMVLMAVTILENLLIKKVFAVNISNNNKYSGHCTLFWVFFFFTL